MTTLLILGALLAPLLYAVTNQLDKILLTDYENSSLTVWTISLLVSIVPAGVIFVFNPSVLEMSGEHIGIMFLNGVMNALLLFLYLKAMDQDEPTATIAFYQLVPVFGLALGYLVFKEMFTGMELLGMGLVMVGTATMIFTTKKVDLRIKTFLLMAVASLCWAGESTIVKYVALKEDVWQAIFWENFSMSIYGVLALTLPSVRKSIKVVLKRPGKMLAISSVNESLYILANVSASIMVTVIPVAMNSLFNTFQTFFVLGLGLILQRFIPGYESELTRRTVLKYIICIAITGLGVYFIGEWE